MATKKDDDDILEGNPEAFLIPGTEEAEKKAARLRHKEARKKNPLIPPDEEDLVEEERQLREKNVFIVEQPNPEDEPEKEAEG